MDYERLTQRELLKISKGDDVEARLRAVKEMDRRKREMPDLTAGDRWTRRSVIVSLTIGVLAIGVTILVSVFLPEIRAALHLSGPIRSARGSPPNHLQPKGMLPGSSDAAQERAPASNPVENTRESARKVETNQLPTLKLGGTSPLHGGMAVQNSVGEIRAHQKPALAETKAAGQSAHDAASAGIVAQSNITSGTASQPVPVQTSTLTPDPAARSPFPPTVPDQHVMDSSASRSPTSGFDDKCVAYYPLTLFIAPQPTGFVVTDGHATIPISFQSRVSAGIFLWDARRHSVACLTSDAEADLDAGYDVFIIWDDSHDIPIDNRSQSSPSRLGAGFRCASETNLRFEAKDKNGPFYILSDKIADPTGTNALLKFSSPLKARRVFNTAAHMAADLCVLDISDSAGNKARHAVVAYFSY